MALPALVAPVEFQQRQYVGGVWLGDLLADMIRAVFCERVFNVDENTTGASPAMDLAKLMARRVAAREVAELVPVLHVESLPVQPVPTETPGR